MMKFYSGKGDDGASTLCGSTARFSKTDPRFEALGAIDELNSYLGICRALLVDDPKIDIALKTAQEDLFIIQAELGAAGQSTIAPLSEKQLRAIEQIIDTLGAEVGEIKEFTLAGGAVLAAHLDFARTLARRAERRLVMLKDILSQMVVPYLNRLSSLLFILARYVNKKEKIKEDHPSYK